MKQYKWTVISCGMLADEVKQEWERVQPDARLLWMKRGLHNSPQTLYTGVQAMIEEHQDCEAILLTYGLCGNGTCGLVSPHTKLVVPAFHDCIHQLLQDVDKDRKKESSSWKKKIRMGHYYLTRGWTLDEEAIYQQSCLILRKYGEERGKSILKEMYHGYTDMDVIETGAYDMAPVLEYAAKAAKINSMKVNSVKGSTDVLHKLLTGNWDQDFIVLDPGEELTLQHFLPRV